MKNNRPPILQSDWSIASRHGKIYVMVEPHISLHCRAMGGLLIIKRSISIVLCLIPNPIIF